MCLFRLAASLSSQATLSLGTTMVWLHFLKQLHQFCWTRFEPKKFARQKSSKAFGTVPTPAHMELRGHLRELTAGLAISPAGQSMIDLRSIYSRDFPSRMSSSHTICRLCAESLTGFL